MVKRTTGEAWNSGTVGKAAAMEGCGAGVGGVVEGLVEAGDGLAGAGGEGEDRGGERRTRRFMTQRNITRRMLGLGSWKDWYAVARIHDAFVHRLTMTLSECTAASE